MKKKCDSDGIETATRIIKDGGIVIFPTDTVYGIGCDPYNKDAVEKIYRIKNREKRKPFPVLGFSKKHLEKIVSFSEKANKIAEKFWPGQLTLILPLKDEKLRNSMSLNDKIAVRVPDNDCVLSILKNCNFLVGTSANISGIRSFTDPDVCEKNVSGYDAFIDDGKISSRGESTIVEINENKVEIQRVGSISKEEILNLF